MTLMEVDFSPFIRFYFGKPFRLNFKINGLYRREGFLSNSTCSLEVTFSCMRDNTHKTLSRRPHVHVLLKLVEVNN